MLKNDEELVDKKIRKIIRNSEYDFHTKLSRQVGLLAWLLAGNIVCGLISIGMLFINMGHLTS